jgi:hypothetical protein
VVAAAADEVPTAPTRVTPERMAALAA